MATHRNLENANMASSREHLNREPVGAQTIGREQFDAAAGAAQASPVAVAA